MGSQGVRHHLATEHASMSVVRVTTWMKEKMYLSNRNLCDPDIPANFTMRKFSSYFTQNIFWVLKREYLSSLRDIETIVT